MDNADEANSNDRQTWEWRPGVGYGPFLFGAEPKAIEDVLELVGRSDMGDAEEMTHYSTVHPGIEVSFWTDKLVTVSVSDIAFINGIQVIGEPLAILRKTMATEPEVEEFSTLQILEYGDELSACAKPGPDGLITSISFGIDPEQVLSHTPNPRASQD